MKKRAVYQTIEGYEVINAIGEAASNPAATMGAVELRIEAMSETAQSRAIIQKIVAQREIAQGEIAKAVAKKQADPGADVSAEDAKRSQAEANIAVFESELMPIVKTIEAARLSLYEECAVYFPEGKGEKILSDAEEADLAPKFAGLSEHNVLTLNGKIIPDWRGAEYYIKIAGAWAKAKVDHIGKEIPEGSVLPNNLTGAQRTEMAAQAEAERLAALTPEAKTSEKQAHLDAAADEADRLSRRAAIQGAEFDTAAYYAVKRDEIEAKYA